MSNVIDHLINFRAFFQRSSIARPTNTLLLLGVLEPPPPIRLLPLKTIRPTPKLEDPIAESVRLSFYPEASGDIKVLLKPYHLFTVDFKKSTAFATTPRFAAPYDTHVPLFAYGRASAGNTCRAHYTPGAHGDLGPRLSLPLPAAAEAPLPNGTFENDYRATHFGFIFSSSSQSLSSFGQLPFCFRARSATGGLRKDQRRR